MRRLGNRAARAASFPGSGQRTAVARAQPGREQEQARARRATPRPRREIAARRADAGGEHRQPRGRKDDPDRPGARGVTVRRPPGRSMACAVRSARGDSPCHGAQRHHHAEPGGEDSGSGPDRQREDRHVQFQQRGPDRAAPPRAKAEDDQPPGTTTAPTTPSAPPTVGNECRLRSMRRRCAIS